MGTNAMADAVTSLYTDGPGDGASIEDKAVLAGIIVDLSHETALTTLLALIEADPVLVAEHVFGVVMAQMMVSGDVDAVLSVLARVGLAGE